MGITFWLFSGLAACGAKGAEGDHGAGEVAPSTEGSQADVALEMDGAKLFAQQCALCHGANGDGTSTIPLKKAARSFVDGGFSFGNTPEALLRTITHGIAGSEMPGFGETMSEAQRMALVEHVIALGPERDPAIMGGQTEIVITDRAQVVRGGLPPIEEGGSEVVRGMLVGNADGLTWEYSLEPFRLIAVRQGRFVNRKDWETRGGEPLEPLGKVLYGLTLDESRGAIWSLGPPYMRPWNGPLEGEDTNYVDGDHLVASLAATTIRGGRAWLEYHVASQQMLGATLVQECGEALQVGEFMGFRRIWLFPDNGNPSDSWQARRKAWFDSLPEETWHLGARGLSVREFPRANGEGFVRIEHKPAPDPDGKIRAVEDWLFVNGDWAEAMKQLRKELE